jgi:hypothetical protein
LIPTVLVNDATAADVDAFVEFALLPQMVKTSG